VIKWLLWVSLIAATLLALVAYWAWQWFHLAPADGPQSATAELILVTVVPGSSTRQIAEQLAAAQLLDRPHLWTLAVRALQRGQQLQAGEYAFAPALSPQQLMQQLVTGAVTEYRLSLVEGWTLAQALDAIRAAPKLIWDLGNADSANLFAQLQQRLPAERFVRIRQQPVFAGLSDSDVLPAAEGWLFPDTYQYRAGDRASDLVARAWQRMLTQLGNAWQARQPDLPYGSAAQLLTMASIVEKETGREADRVTIAQVFVRRLRVGMRLQTDPTVIYGLGSHFDGNLTRVHLRTDTPYNSYTRAGLPPTAIALPGASSLRAAAQPATGEFLYFVARGDGSSQFSKTLADHEAAVDRYQRKRHP